MKVTAFQTNLLGMFITLTADIYDGPLGGILAAKGEKCTIQSQWIGEDGVPYFTLEVNHGSNKGRLLPVVAHHQFIVKYN